MRVIIGIALLFTTICSYAQTNNDSLDIVYTKNAVKECQKLTLEGLILIRKQRLLRMQFCEARRLKMVIRKYEAEIGN